MATQESGHSEQAAIDKKRKTAGVDQDMVDFFGGGGGASGAGTPTLTQDELESLHQQCEDYEQDISYLRAENEKLKSDLAEMLPQSNKTPSSQAVLEDEAKRQAQLLLVKEAEIDSLRKQIKQYKETLDNEDMSKEVSELAKKLAFSDKEKEVKDMTIAGLRNQITEKEDQLKKAQEKEKNFEDTVAKLTMQMAMM